MSFHEHSLEHPSKMVGQGRRTGRNRKFWLTALVVLTVVGALGYGAWQTLGNGVTSNALDQAASVAVARTQTSEASETSEVSWRAVDTTAPPDLGTTPSAVVEKAQPSLGIVAIAGTEGVDGWDSPGSVVLQTWPAGTVLKATARSEDGAWLSVTDAEGAAGWVEATSVVAFGMDDLPIQTPVIIVANAVEQAGAAVPTDVQQAAGDASTAQEEVPAEAQGVTSDASTVNNAPLIAENLITATVSLTGARLNVRAGPDETFPVIGKLYLDQVFVALARNDAGDWVQLALPEVEGGFGWVATDYVRLNGAMGNLPISPGVSSAPAWEGAQASEVSKTSEASSVADSSAGLTGILVFQSTPGGRFYAHDLTSGALQPLTYGFDPAISPDASTVAFTRDGGENGIYLVDVDGSDERLIFSGRATLSSPKWSPDGAWIVFTRRDEYAECRELGPMCVAESELLTMNPDFPVDQFPLAKEYEFNLARVDVNGQNYRDLPALESARSPDWSNAGIVYQSAAGLQLTDDTPDAQNQLVTFNYLKPFYHDPDWRPDGGRIVFMGKEGSHWEIFAVNPDGSGMTALTRPVTTLVDEIPSNVAPAWSPDGEHIVFLSNRGDDKSAGDWQLWVMDGDGSNQRPLPLDVSITYAFGDEQAVSWSQG